MLVFLFMTLVLDPEDFTVSFCIFFDSPQRAEAEVRVKDDHLLVHMGSHNLQTTVPGACCVGLRRI